ncbi:hypothetical protein QE430_003185 [Microbacterium testaceum]|uniref:hypothetical protein n=1 Tax=Microbacterium testaceum TaxID=2033 RepID=UPI002782F809|nr:hypothetical protein [Microbacterium testaceum]MDQ1174878.1 hypothetical protein [Microbacterium testaceum]
MPSDVSRVPARRFTTVLSAALGAALLGSALAPLPAFAADGPRVVINEAYLKGRERERSVHAEVRRAL